MKHFVLSLFAVVFSYTALFSQVVYFDKSGKSTDESSAYYYRTLKTAPDVYISKFKNGDATYFEGRIIQASSNNEADNVYAGKCVWYYKNGRKKQESTYNNTGELNGTSTLYYESGARWKEETWVNGELEGHMFTEYNEDGSGARIFVDHFDDNSNEWDDYASNLSECSIKGGQMNLVSLTKSGTSRYINLSDVSDNFAIELKVDVSNLIKAKASKAGLIFGFKDWDNYNFFAIDGDSFWIGTVFEGILSMRADDSYTSSIQTTGYNTLKIISNGEKFFYSINGSVQYSTKTLNLLGKNFGVIVSGKASVMVDDFTYKNFEVATNQSPDTNDDNVKSTGSGVMFNAEGYVLTNHHVVDKAKQVVIEMTRDGASKTYNAEVVVVDKENDLALVQIKDSTFVKPKSIPFSIRSSGGIDVGASVFTLGYPMALTGMGKEVKLSDGKVSAKTGYNSATNAFTTTIPVQPGNSGGPIFNTAGELVGLINAKVENSDNVSYGIKGTYIMNLLDLAPKTPEVPTSKELNGKALEQQVKALSNYVVLIKIK